MAEKLYYSMGEVAEMFDVNPSLIRYWGSQFDALRPKRNKKGNRMFTPADVETLKLIYHLVKERKMTLEGARKALKAERAAAKSDVAPEVELLERLQGVRAMLLQVRETLGADGVDVVAEDVTETEVPSESVAPQTEEREEKEDKVAKKGRKPAAEPKTKAEPVKEERPLPFYEQTLF